MAKLNQTARDTIKEFGEVSRALGGPKITIAGYIRHYFGDAGWHGDRCGCIDGRCIGYYHDGEDGCKCLESWLESYATASGR